MQHPSDKVRLTATIVLVVFAFVTIIATPLIVKTILPEIIDNQLIKYEKMSTSGDPELVKKAPLIIDTPYLVSFFYPLWMALAMFGGVTALVIAKPFNRGEVWAKGVALLATAMPSIAGAYMLIPWINFVGFGNGLPYPIFIALFGLIPYFWIVLAEKVDGTTKLAYFLVFMALGIAAAHSFTNGHASFRLQWMLPQRPLWPPTTWVLWLSTQFMWLGTIALLFSIFYTGLRKKAGFYLGLIGGITVTIANFWTHLVRGTTSDYIVGGSLGLAVVVFMMIPAFKKRLFDEQEIGYPTGE
jgi:hypothetical protein